MQLVATIDTPFENQLFIGRKIHGFAEAFWRTIASIWDRLCEALPEAAAVPSDQKQPPVRLSGYYGGAYGRLRASMPVSSCVEFVGADPFPQPSTSRRGSGAVEKTETTPDPDGEQDLLYAVLCADWVMPARMM